MALALARRERLQFPGFFCGGGPGPDFRGDQVVRHQRGDHPGVDRTSGAPGDQRRCRRRDDMILVLG